MGNNNNIDHPTAGAIAFGEYRSSVKKNILKNEFFLSKNECPFFVRLLRNSLVLVQALFHHQNLFQ